MNKCSLNQASPSPFQEMCKLQRGVTNPAKDIKPEINHLLQGAGVREVISGLDYDAKCIDQDLWTRTGWTVSGNLSAFALPTQWGGCQDIIATWVSSDVWFLNREHTPINRLLQSSYFPSFWIFRGTCTSIGRSYMENCQTLMLGLNFETYWNQEFNYPVGVTGGFGFIPNVKFLTDLWVRV